MAPIDFNNLSVPQVKPHKLAHVVLKTPDKARMVEFYTQFLGAHVQWQNEVLAFLTYDEEHHRIAFAQLPVKGRDPQTAGLAHLAFTFESLSHLLLAYRQRAAKGIKPIWCVNHGPTVSIYYADPDGNQIETQYDVWDTPEPANEFMNSAEFAENPFGVDFDPEVYIKRLEAGEKEEVLGKRENKGPRGIENVPQVMLAG